MKLRKDIRLFVEYLVHLALGSMIAAAFLTVSYGFEWFAEALAHQPSAKPVSLAADIVSWVLLSLDALSLLVFLLVTTYRFLRRMWKHLKDHDDE